VNKRETRRHLIQLRAALSPEQRSAASQSICEHLMASPVWPADPVALFCALPQEVDVSALEAAAPGQVAYPQVQGDDLVFRQARAHQLQPVPPYGVREPTAQFEPIESFSLIIVPGLGFTATGGRIGYGRGFYDRYLRAARALQPNLITVGVAFACQLVDDLPLEPWDEPLDGLVTEQGLLRFSRG